MITDGVVHEIDTGSTRPIRCNPRKLSPKKIKIQQELVDKMLEDGQIEPSDSAWSAPTVLVTKKDGSTRFYMDYHHLNVRTKKDAFPLPRIDDSLSSLRSGLVLNLRLSKRILASKTLRERETQNGVRHSLRIISVCCDALWVM